MQDHISLAGNIFNIFYTPVLLIHHQLFKFNHIFTNIRL